MSSDASDLDFQEVQNQLQILEHIAYKEGLSDRNVAWQHELQRAREIQQQLEDRANEKNLEPGKEREL